MLIDFAQKFKLPKISRATLRIISLIQE